MLDNLDNLNGVVKEIDILQKRSELLEEILRKYDYAHMTFDIPEKWNSKILPAKLSAESPRHLLRDKIRDTLSEDELSCIKNYY